MTTTGWYRAVLVVLAGLFVVLLYGLMHQHQIANPFLVGALGLALGIDLALLLASFWQPRDSRKR